MKILVTRPEEDAAGFAATLAGCGVESLVAPLIAIRPVAGLTVDLKGVAAILLTSANGARALAAATARRDVPVLAVGPATAAAARALDFADVSTAGGDVALLAQAVTDRLRPADGPLLHVAGSVVAGDLAGELGAAGFEVRRLVAYTAEPATVLPEQAAAALATNALDGVAFFSPRTATTFVKLVSDAGLGGSLARLVAFCLSRAVAERLAGTTWGASLVAHEPDGDRLAALICAHAGQR